MHSFEEVVAALKAAESGQIPLETPIAGVANEVAGTSDPVNAAVNNT